MNDRPVRETAAYGPLRHVLSELVHAARAALGAEACSITLLDPQINALRFFAVSGQGEGELEGTALPPDRGLAYWGLRTAMPLAVRDLDDQTSPNSSEFNRGFAESTGFVPQSILVAPVNSASSPVGVLQALDFGAMAANQDPLETLERFAGLAGAIIDNTGIPAATEHLAAAEAVREIGERLSSTLLTTPQEARRLLLSALLDLS